MPVFTCTAIVRPGSLRKIITVIIPVPRTGTRLHREFLCLFALFHYCSLALYYFLKNIKTPCLSNSADRGIYISYSSFCFLASVFDTEANGHAALGVGADAVTDAVRIDTAKTGGAKG